MKTLETGPITNHVNFAHHAHGTFAYVMVGGLNEVEVLRTDNFSQVATILVGPLPHGLWPSHLRLASAVVITLLSCSASANKPPLLLWWPEPQGPSHGK